MARRLAGFRPLEETFRGVRWHRANRRWHEANKRVDPRFSAACKLDWSQTLKRPDTRHSDGRQLGIVARVLGRQRIIYFVAYVKRNGFLNVISIQYADTEEENVFAHAFP